NTARARIGQSRPTGPRSRPGPRPRPRRVGDDRRDHALRSKRRLRSATARARHQLHQRRVLTPERMLRALAGRRLATQGLRPEPGAWRNATVGDLMRSLEQAGQLEPHTEALSQPGWARALARATETLETAGVEPD